MVRVLRTSWISEPDTLFCPGSFFLYRKLTGGAPRHPGGGSGLGPWKGWGLGVRPKAGWNGGKLLLTASRSLSSRPVVRGRLLSEESLGRRGAGQGPPGATGRAWSVRDPRAALLDPA